VSIALLSCLRAATNSVTADVNTFRPASAFAFVTVLVIAALLVCATFLCYVYATASVAADVNTVSPVVVSAAFIVLVSAALLVCSTVL